MFILILLNITRNSATGSADPCGTPIFFVKFPEVGLMF